MSRWWDRVEHGLCGRCGTPWHTVKHGGWRNTCDPCHAAKARQADWIVLGVQVAMVLTLVYAVIAVAIEISA